LPAGLARLPHLRLIYVSGNLLDSEKAAAFQELAPHVSISWRTPDEMYFH
jgi:hypothetical protein